MLEFFSNRYVIALGIPLLFLLAGGIARKLVYGGWKWEYFYLGTEGALAAISGTLIYVAELMQKTQAQQASVAIGVVLGSMGFLAFALLILLLSMAFQQDWEKDKTAKVNILLWGVVSNIIGVGLLTVFILWVKGL